MIDSVWLAPGVAPSMILTTAVPLADAALRISTSKLEEVWPAPMVTVDWPVPAARATVEVPELEPTVKVPVWAVPPMVMVPEVVEAPTA